MQSLKSKLLKLILAIVLLGISHYLMLNITQTESYLFSQLKPYLNLVNLAIEVAVIIIGGYIIISILKGIIFEYFLKN